MRFDLHVPGDWIEPRRRAKRGELDDMADAGSDSGVDQGGLVLDLAGRRGVANENPIGAPQGVFEGFFSIEVNGSRGDPGGKASLVRPARERDHVNVVGREE